MPHYVLDTCVLVAYIRKSKQYEQIEQLLLSIVAPDKPIISVVTLAEIGAFARRNNWGTSKIKLVDELLNRLIVIGIENNDTKLIDAYCEIDTYSQNKHNSLVLNGTARNMGKNDIWIAATTLVLGAELITADNDFEHLNGVFFKVHLIS